MDRTPTMPMRLIQERRASGLCVRCGGTQQDPYFVCGDGAHRGHECWLPCPRCCEPKES